MPLFAVLRLASITVAPLADRPASGDSNRDGTDVSQNRLRLGPTPTLSAPAARQPTGQYPGVRHRAAARRPYALTSFLRAILFQTTCRSPGSDIWRQKSLISVFLPCVSLCQVYQTAPQPASCGYVSWAVCPTACPKSSFGMDGVSLNFQVESAPTLPLRFRNSGPTLHRARAGRETAMQATAAFAPQRPLAARCSPPGLSLAELGPVGLRSGTARQKKATLLPH